MITPAPTPTVGPPIWTGCALNCGISRAHQSTRETIKGRFFILTKRIEPVTSILVIIIHSKNKLCQILVYGLQYYFKRETSSQNPLCTSTWSKHVSRRDASVKNKNIDVVGFLFPWYMTWRLSKFSLSNTFIWIRSLLGLESP